MLQGNTKSQTIHSQPISSGNTRTKVSSRKGSKNIGVYSGGLDGSNANNTNLVNFYNSNLLDEML